METIAIPLVLALAYGPLVLMGAVWLAAGVLRLMGYPTMAQWLADRTAVPKREPFEGEQPNSHHR